jgi:hypothetical protein
MMSAMRRSVAVAVLACAAAVGAAEAPSPAPALADLDASLFLIGDAGVPAGKDPVLEALAREAGRDPSRSVIVFLGDNIYPRGLPPPGGPGRLEAERRMDAQIAAARDSRAAAVFVPGNHDWAARDGGWNAVKRQGEYVVERGGPAMQVLPAGGCPGPVVRDVGERLRLVVLDTEWWLHRGAKPQHPTSSCPADSETEVLDALSEAIRSAGDRRVVVAGHHPLATGGTHGGFFDWTDHVFPLRASRSWLWIPLPGVGSSYPVARQRGVSNQDMSGPLNRRMREAFAGVFSQHAPLVYAAGHEHNLQVLKGKDAPYLLVSGAGAFGHVTRARSTPATVFARTASGFMRIDVGREGEARLGVWVVTGRDRSAEAFSTRLD